MSGIMNRNGLWNDQVWRNIDEGVRTTVGAIRVARKVFQLVQLPNVTSVPADIFNPKEMSIAEGQTRPYIELAVEFSQTNGQVRNDILGATGITLAKLAAKNLALAEDMVIFQGNKVKLPQSIQIESGADSLDGGIVGLVPADRSIHVCAPDSSAPTNSGGAILAAVAQGVALLSNSENQQAEPFALVLDTSAYAATWGSVINGAPAYTVLNPVLTGGIYGTGAMPANTGLLIALGGDPTTIYFSDDPITEFTNQGSGGRFFFRTFERIQYVARDDRAFLKLDFSYLANK